MKDEETTNVGHWATDPTGRFPLRWRESDTWTDRVSLGNGVEATDSLPVELLGTHPTSDSGSASVFAQPPAASPPGPPQAPPAEEAGSSRTSGTEPRPLRPAAPAAAIAILAAAFLAMAISLWGLPWIASGEGADDLSLSKSELRAVLDEFDEAFLPSPFLAITDHWVNWGADLAIAALLVAVALAAARMLIWGWVVIAAASLALWQAAVILDIGSETDWNGVGIGLWATLLTIGTIGGTAQYLARHPTETGSRAVR